MKINRPGERVRILKWVPKFLTKHQTQAIAEGRYPPIRLNKDGKTGVAVKWSYITMDRIEQNHGEKFGTRQEAIDAAIADGFVVYDENNVKVS